MRFRLLFTSPKPYHKLFDERKKSTRESCFPLSYFVDHIENYPIYSPHVVGSASKELIYPLTTHLDYLDYCMWMVEDSKLHNIIYKYVINLNLYNLTFKTFIYLFKKYDQIIYYNMCIESWSGVTNLIHKCNWHQTPLSSRVVKERKQIKNLDNLDIWYTY